MRTFFFPLWRGYSIRMLIKSGTIQKLIEYGDQIVLLLPDPDEAQFWKGRVDPAIKIETLELTKLEKIFRTRFHSYTRLIRYLTYRLGWGEKQGTNKYHSKTLNWQTGKKDIRTELFYLRIKTLAWLASHSIFFRTIFNWIETKFLKQDFHREIYERYKPDAIIVPSVGYSMDALIMGEARRHGAKIITVVQSFDNPSSKGIGPLKPDHVLVWNEVNKEEIIKYHGISPHRCHVVGVPHWDQYFRPEVHDLTVRSKAPLVIFMAFASHNVYRENFAVAESILEKMESGYYEKSVKLLIRPHPTIFMSSSGKDNVWYQEANLKMTELKNRFGDLVEFDLPRIKSASNKVFDFDQEDQIALAKILSRAAILVNVYSTMMIEAAIFDLPIVNIAYGKYWKTDLPMSIYDEWEHIKPINQTKGVWNAYSSDELHLAIKSYLSKPELHRENRKKLLDLMVPANRGSASQALATELHRLV